jgi:NAD(P)-dependent dehydrogenase (short-subunit alcohol dehydrogenase family)
MVGIISLAFIEERARCRWDNPEQKNLQISSLKKMVCDSGRARDEAVAEKAIQLSAERFGGLVIVSCCGGSGENLVTVPCTLTAAGWNQTFELNLTSMMFSNKAALNFL